MATRKKRSTVAAPEYMRDMTVPELRKLAADDKRPAIERAAARSILRASGAHLEMTAEDIAVAFGVTTQAVRLWPIKPGPDGLYDLREVIRYKLQSVQRTSQTEDADQRRWLAARAEKAELQVQVIRSEVIPTEIVERVWTDMIAAFNAALDAHPARVAREVLTAETRDQVTIEGIVRQSRDEARAKMESFCLDTYRRLAGGASINQEFEEESESEAPPAPRRASKKKAAKKKTRKKAAKR